MRVDIQNLLTVAVRVPIAPLDQDLSAAEGKVRSFDRTAERALGGVDVAAKKTGASIKGMAASAAAANDNIAGAANRAALGINTMAVAARGAIAALGAIAGSLAVASLISYADAWSDMQSRVGAAIKDMDAAPAMMQRIVDIANASYSPLEQTVEIYSRNVSVLRDLGKGATEAADFTEALNHALVITATRGERAASVQNALSKAMAVGKLQADGLETVLANGGRVAEALAKQLGTNVNGLRSMAAQGKITGAVITEALIGNLETLRKEAGDMPATIGDAFTRLRTNLSAFIGQMDQSTGASQRVSAAIMLFANNIDVVARVAAVASVALMTAFAPAILAAMAAGLTALGTAGVAAIGAITAASAANPLGALAVGITTAVTAIYLFRDEIQKAIGVDVAGIVKDGANLIINSFRACFEDIRVLWAQLPNILGAAVVGAVNAVIGGINVIVRAAKTAIDQVIELANNIPSVNIGTTDPSKNLIDPMKNTYAGELGKAINERNAKIAEIMSSDPIGAIASVFKAATPEVQGFSNSLDAVNDNLGQLDGTGGKAAREAERLAKAYGGIVASAQDRIAQAELEYTLVGKATAAAEALRIQQDCLGRPKRAGINLSPEQKNAIHDQAEAFGAFLDGISFEQENHQ